MPANRIFFDGEEEKKKRKKKRSERDRDRDTETQRQRERKEKKGLRISNFILLGFISSDIVAVKVLVSAHM